MRDVDVAAKLLDEVFEVGVGRQGLRLVNENEGRLDALDARGDVPFKRHGDEDHPGPTAITIADPDVGVLVFVLARLGEHRPSAFLPFGPDESIKLVPRSAFLSLPARGNNHQRARVPVLAAVIDQGVAANCSFSRKTLAK